MKVEVLNGNMISESFKTYFWLTFPIEIQISTVTPNY